MWHITYYMFFLPDEYFTEISRPMMAVVGIVLMIFWSPLFVELRRLTKSVWPCVILHSMEDAVPTMLFVTANVFRIKENNARLDTRNSAYCASICYRIRIKKLSNKKEHAVSEI